MEDIVNFSKNAQIFNSLWKTFKEYNGSQKGGSDEVPSNVTEMNLDQFSQFVNCGQYRNKDDYSKNTCEICDAETQGHSMPEFV